MQFPCERRLAMTPGRVKLILPAGLGRWHIGDPPASPFAQPVKAKERDLAIRAIRTILAQSRKPVPEHALLEPRGACRPTRLIG